MSSFFASILRTLTGSSVRRSSARRPARTFRPGWDRLEDRLTPAFVSAFNPVTHVLTITGTAAGEAGTVSRTVGGAILLNGVATGASIFNTDRINILCGSGNDVVALNMTNGAFAPGFSAEAFPAEIEISINGGLGGDTLVIQGGAAADRIDLGAVVGAVQANLNADADVDVWATQMEMFRVSGGAGNDILNANGSAVVGAPMALAVSLFGEIGNDTLLGGNGNDYLSGGSGNDLMRGGFGNDRLYGDGDRDTLYGDAGNDTLHGGLGLDNLWGGTGNDYLDGGGNDGVVDILKGESGKDKFVFDPVLVRNLAERAASDFNPLFPDFDVT